MLFLLLVSSFISSCSKKEKAVGVYGPPAQKIKFSEVTDLLIDSTGKTISLKAKIKADNGVLELAQYVPKKQSREYIRKTEKIIRSLSPEKYRAKVGENG